MNHLDANSGSFFGQSSYKNYKYNGKELQETGMYDYGARMYMPDLGKFGMHDPLSELTFDPYGYAYNNPIFYNDPTGMEGEEAASGDSGSGGTGGETGSGNGNCCQGQNEGPKFGGLGYDGGIRQNITWSDGLQGADINGINLSGNTKSSPIPVSGSVTLGGGGGNGRKMTPEEFRRQDIILHPWKTDGPVQMIGGAGDVFGIWEVLGMILGRSDSNVKYAVVPLLVVKGQEDKALKVLAAEKGLFSVADRTGYPSSLPKPTGPFKLLEGAEYDAARKAANSANAALHRTDASLKGLQIHEIHPVKFGGSPTNLSNKAALTPQEHRLYNTFWQKLQKSTK